MPNTRLQALAQAQAIHAANTEVANDLVKARPVFLSGTLIKDLLTQSCISQRAS